MKYNDKLLKPPGPIVTVTVRSAGQTAPKRSELAEIDTGSAISVIPQKIARQLHLTPDRPVLTRGYDEIETPHWIYIVDLEILGYKIESISVVAVPRKTILLGRNVLQHFVVTLDGKAQSFEMIDP